MESNQLNNLNNFLDKRQGQDKNLILKRIIYDVKKGTGLSISKLKKQYSEEQLFYVALKQVTTTKKALCKSLNINIDNACRYKRKLEIQGYLVQSIDEVICPFTKHPAHLISTNPKEFKRLKKSNTNQLNFFE